MNQKVIEAEISKVLFDLGPQIYELAFDGSETAEENFASFAWLNFGQFQNEKKYFRNAVSNGKSLVVIHKCPKFRNINKNAYSVRIPRKDALVSCSACHYRFDTAIALPVSVENKKKPAQATGENMNSFDNPNPATEDPLAILKVRLAKGEITSQEYKDLRKIIES